LIKSFSLINIFPLFLLSFLIKKNQIVHEQINTFVVSYHNHIYAWPLAPVSTKFLWLRPLLLHKLFLGTENPDLLQKSITERWVQILWQVIILIHILSFGIESKSTLPAFHPSLPILVCRKTIWFDLLLSFGIWGDILWSLARLNIFILSSLDAEKNRVFRVLSKRENIKVTLFTKILSISSVFFHPDTRGLQDQGLVKN